MASNTEQQGHKTHFVEDGLQVVQKQPDLEVQPQQYHTADAKIAYGNENMQQSYGSDSSHQPYNGEHTQLFSYQDGDDKMTEYEWQQRAKQQRRTICGLSAVLFWIIVVLLTLGLIGAILGVGLGVGLKKSNNSSASSSNNSSSPSPTVPGVAATAATISAPVSTATNNGCVNGTTYISSNLVQFVEACNTNFQTGGSTTYAQDIFTIMSVSSFVACMESCAFFRAQLISPTDGGGICSSVTYVEGTCWLKNATALFGTSSNQTEIMEHAQPTPAISQQSANIVNQDGSIV